MTQYSMYVSNLGSPKCQKCYTFYPNLTFRQNIIGTTEKQQEKLPVTVCVPIT